MKKYVERIVKSVMGKRDFVANKIDHLTKEVMSYKYEDLNSVDLTTDEDYVKLSNLLITGTTEDVTEFLGEFFKTHNKSRKPYANKGEAKALDKKMKEETMELNILETINYYEKFLEGKEKIKKWWIENSFEVAMKRKLDNVFKSDVDNKVLEQLIEDIKNVSVVNVHLKKSVDRIVGIYGKKLEKKLKVIENKIKANVEKAEKPKKVKAEKKAKTTKAKAEKKVVKDSKITKLERTAKKVNKKDEETKVEETKTETPEQVSTEMINLFNSFSEDI